MFKLVFFILFSTSFLKADDIYVVGAGQAYANFASATAQALADHSGPFAVTVRVQAVTGTYAEQVVVPAGLDPSASNPFILEAFPGHVPVIASGSSYGLRLSGVANVIIQGFNFRDHGVNALRIDAAPGVMIVGNHSENSGAAEIQVQDCPGAQVLGNTLKPATGNGVLVFNSPGSAVWSNIVRPFGSSSPSYGAILSDSPSSDVSRNQVFGATHGLGIFSSGYVTVSANVSMNRLGSRGLVLDNSPHALLVNNLLVGQDIGLEAQGSTACAILNNSIWEHATAGLYAHAACAPLTLRNNLLQGFVALYLDPGTQASLSSNFNVFQSVANAAIGAGSYPTLSDWRVSGNDLNGLELNPAFLNANGSLPEDFKLNPGSPVLRLAANLASFLSDDYFGNARPVPTLTPWDPGFHAPSASQASPTPSPSVSPTPSMTPLVPTASPTQTPLATATDTRTPAPSSTITVTPSITPTHSPTAYAIQHDKVVTYPNPFRPHAGAVHIVFDPSPEATVRIFDMAGALVIELPDAVKQPALGHASWDARNAAGQLVASGLYYVVVSTPKFTRSNRFTVLQP